MKIAESLKKAFKTPVKDRKVVYVDHQKKNTVVIKYLVLGH